MLLSPCELRRKLSTEGKGQCLCPTWGALPRGALDSRGDIYHARMTQGRNFQRIENKELEGADELCIREIWEMASEQGRLGSVP